MQTASPGKPVQTDMGALIEFAIGDDTWDSNFSPTSSKAVA